MTRCCLNRRPDPQMSGSSGCRGGAGVPSLASRHLAGGRMHAGLVPGGMGWVLLTGKRQMEGGDESHVAPGPGQGAHGEEPWRKRSHVERLGGCCQPGQESRSFSPRFIREQTFTDDQMLLQRRGYRPCVRSGGPGGGQATHEERGARPFVCAECWGGKRTAEGGGDAACWGWAGTGWDLSSGSRGRPC